MRAGLAGLVLALPGLAWADPCALVPGKGTIWDHDGEVTDVAGMTVLIVTRHQSRQPLAGSPVDSQLWTDDVPSDTLGSDAVCDRVQLETPLPFDTWDRQPIAMQQGERMLPGVDIAAKAPGFAGRIAADDRQIDLAPGSYFVRHVPDLDAPDWRDVLLAEAANAGQIDAGRWVVGLPGALYLVPVETP